MIYLIYNHVMNLRIQIWNRWENKDNFWLLIIK